MGTNIHAFAHRLTALSMACLASAGLIFCALSGFGCSFIKIQALEGESIGNAIGDVYENVETAYLGVRCLSGSDAPFYGVDGVVDRLWNYSRIFLYIGIALGATTTLFAWLLGSCVRPTAPRWRVLSVLAACSAVLQIPIFLVFESDNCNFDVTRQTCEFSSGAYLNVVSVSIWIVMTIWVQCLRAPRWDEELDAWRVSGNKSSSSASEFAKGGGSGIGDGTVETMEVAFSSPRAREQSISLPLPYIEGNGKDDDIEKQVDQSSKAQHCGVKALEIGMGVETDQRHDEPVEVTEGDFSVGASNASVRKTAGQKGIKKSSFAVGQWGRNRSKESTSITDAMKQNLNNMSRSQKSKEDDSNSSDKNIVGGINDQNAATVTLCHAQNKEERKKDALSFIKSLKSNIPRVKISKSSRLSSGKNNSSSLVADLACNSQPMHHEPPITPIEYSEIAATVDKSVAADTGKHAINRSENTDTTSAPPAPPKNKTAPGFHISCVYEDGTRQEAHFPSIPNCCIGMGDASDEEETNFRRFPQVSDEFQMVGFDDYDDYNNENSDSADFLVRKLRKEEEAAAARRAERNMAPVASFEFVTSNNIENGDRRKNGNAGRDVVVNDDVSEMTRGSGWASGVSEILDDTDLRHQPRAILEDLAQRY